jgi:penicillin-binding protein-related factor A (putative recombinase)
MSYAGQDKIGKEFENKIIHMNDTYRKLRYAFIRKAYPQMIRQGRHFTYKSAEGYDFYGSIYHNQGHPTPVYFECKTTLKPEIRVLAKDVKGSGIEYKQLTTLIELQENGDKAFILWEIRSENKILILNPKSLYLFVGKTIKLKELNNYESLPKNSTDYLKLF